MSHKIPAIVITMVVLASATSVRAVSLPVTSGLYARYDASSLGLSDGQDVGAWTDSSGNGHDLSQYDGPGHYVTSGIGGQPSIRLDDSTSLYTTEASGFGLNGDPNYTIFTVVQTPSSFDDYRHPFTWGGGGDLESQQIQFASGSGQLSVAGGFGSNFNTDFAADVSSNLLVSVSKTSGAMNATTSIKVNGTGVNDDGSSTSGSPNIQTGTFAWVGYSADAGAGGFGSDGLVAEILIYNRVLTAEEENAVGYYLQNKYGLSGSYTEPVATPEPSSLILVGFAFMAMMRVSRRRDVRCS